jgi:uncharacterized membrane protein YgcG
VIATSPAPLLVAQSRADAVDDPYALLAQAPASGPKSLRILQTIPSALGALRANKGRSILTTLGIIIGVAAVIAIVALGQGASASVSSQLQGLGTNLLTIMPGSTRSGGAAGGAGSGTTLKGGGGGGAGGGRGGRPPPHDAEGGGCGRHFTESERIERREPGGLG